MEINCLIEPTILKDLVDKSSEKRRTALKEIEKSISKFWITSQIDKIEQLCFYINDNLIESKYVNYKINGMMALTSVFIALDKNANVIMDFILPRLINNLFNSEKIIKFHSCEALFNAAKILKSHMLNYFPEIFYGLLCLINEKDRDTKNAFCTLNSILQDIVTFDENLDENKIINVLKENIYSTDEEIQNFVLSWINVIKSKPKFNFFHFFPELIDGIIRMYGSSNHLNKIVSRLIKDSIFEKELIQRKEGSKVIMLILPIILSHLSINQENEKKILLLFKIIIYIVKNYFSSIDILLPSLFCSIIPIISNTPNIKVAKSGLVIETILKDSIQKLDSPLDYEKIIASFFKLFECKDVTSNNLFVKILEWNSFFLGKINSKEINDFVSNQLLGNDKLFIKLLKIENDDITNNLIDNIYSLATFGVVANEKFDGYYLEQFLKIIIIYLNENNINDKKSTHLLKNLANKFSNSNAFIKICDTTLLLINENQIKTEFAENLIVILNDILFTSTCLQNFRKEMKILNIKSFDKYFSIYKLWSYNLISSVSLCLLTSLYPLGAFYVNLLTSSNYELKVDDLVQIDTIIQMIELPILERVRIHLVNHVDSHYLLYTLTVFLMLLPQSETQKILYRRIKPILQFKNIDTINYEYIIKGVISSISIKKFLIERFNLLLTN